jgi:hypothetical protein
VANDGAIAAGKNRATLAGALDKCGMTDEVDTAMDRMQAARAHPALDRAAIDARREELSATHHPALARGECSDDAVDSRVPNSTIVGARTLRAGFGSHTDPKPARVLRAPASVGLGTARRYRGPPYLPARPPAPPTRRSFTRSPPNRTTPAT